MLKKPRAISKPDTANVHCLCRDRVTSHGKNESIDATDAPRPNKTSSEGKAQQSNVPTELNSEK